MNKHLTLTEDILVKTFLAIILGFICFGFFAFAQTTTTMPIAAAITFTSSPWQWFLANYVGVVAVITTCTTVMSELIPMITAKNYGGIVELIAGLFIKKT